MQDTLSRREMMIRRQLEARGVHDPAVLAAMREVPRELFVPSHLVGLAYEDGALPIEEGQTISQPYMVAYMTEALQLSPGSRVLEIGTGSGYAAAVLSRVAGEVHSVERIPSLADTARKRLIGLGYANVAVHVGDGTLGWPEHAPYDGIVVTAGAPSVPKPLMDQLVVGGKLVIPVGSHPRMQTLMRVSRSGQKDYREESLMEVVFVPLIGESGWKPQ